MPLITFDKVGTATWCTPAYMRMVAEREAFFRGKSSASGFAMRDAPCCPHPKTRHRRLMVGYGECVDVTDGVDCRCPQFREARV